jgi:hypothetical protein
MRASYGSGGWGPAALALVVLGAAATPAARADAPKRGAGAATFAWGVPCRVPVVEVGLRNGNTVKISYEIALERSADRAELRVRLENYAFLEVNGQDVTVPAMRESLRKATLMTAAVPAIRVSGAGAYLGIVDLEKSVSWMLEQPYFRQEQPAEAEKLRKTMLSPQMLESFNNEMGGIWSTWVGAWIGRRLAPGETVAFTDRVAIDHASFPAPTRISNLGDAAVHPGTVRLRLESTIRGKDLAEALSAFVTDIAKDLGAQDSASGLLSDGDRRIVMEVDTELATLRPRRALFDMVLHVKFKDGKERSYPQRRETTFHWDRAQGACAPHP